MATANDLNISQAGIVTFDGTATFSGRTLIAGANISIVNANGVSGNPVIAAIGSSPTSGNRVLIQTINASASTSIDFVTGLTGYDLYEIDFYSVVTTGVTTQNIRFSTDAGATWEATNYNYGYNVSFPNSGGSGGGAAGTGIVISTVSTDSATYAWSGSFTFQNLASSSLYKSTFGTSVGQFSGCLQFLVSGYWASSSIVNGIRFIADAGTFTSGTFKLYGIVN